MNIYLKIGFIFLIFAYCALCIIWPIYKWDMTYAMSMLVLFWFPVLIMLAVNFKWLWDHELLKPFLYANLVMVIVAFFFEYVSIGMKVWDFSQEHHKLLGINVIGLPIEEFMFWFGATPFSILLFFSFYRILNFHRKSRLCRRTEKRVIVSTWAFLAIIFLPIAMHLHKAINAQYAEIKKQHGDENVFYWPAVLWTIALFWFTMIFVEHHSIVCGHWVFNAQRIWELYLWKIPIEEFIFYTLGPVFVVILLHFIELKPKIGLKGQKVFRKN